MQSLNPQIAETEFILNGTECEGERKSTLFKENDRVRENEKHIMEIV